MIPYSSLLESKTRLAGIRMVRINAVGQFSSMTDAAIYLRISQDDEDDGLAIARQRKDALAIIDARGWRAVDTYVDQGISASKRDVNRPAYDRMERDYLAGRFTAIVCYDLDRLTRQPRQLEDWIEAAETRGLALVTVTGEADLTTDNGRLFARIKASVARAEIERKGKRERDANDQRFERGLSAPGRRLYGFETDGRTARPEEADVVRSIYADMLAGASIHGIARSLNERGILLTTGKGKWVPTKIRDTLRNRRYSGEVKHRDGTWAQSDAIDLIVDPEDAARVRLIVNDPARQIGPGPARRWLLSGIAECGICHAPLKHFWQSGGRPGSYVCSQSYNHVCIKDSTAERDAIAGLAEVIAEESTHILNAAAADDAGSVTAVKTALDKNEHAAMATSRDRDEGLLSAASARARLLELRGERLALERRVEAIRTERSAAGALLSLAADLYTPGREPVREGLRVADEVVANFDGLSLDQRREVLRSLVYVVVQPDNGARWRQAHPKRVYVASRVAVEGGTDH